LGTYLEGSDMARKLRDTSLESREARLRLKVRGKPYWRLLEAGRHLGYRKGARGGTWVARAFAGDGRYLETGLGLADDASDADGVHVLSFGQAQDKARAWCAAQARVRDGLEPARQGPYLLKHAVTDYLAEHYASKGRARKAIDAQINAHILSGLGELETAKLTTQRIRQWHHDLAKTPARRRTKATAEKRNTAGEPKTQDAIRRRKSTANNVLTILRAILNHGWREGRIADDSAWRKVKPFAKVDAPVIRYLSVAESVRLVNASAPDLRQIVRAALLTGCRYGEVGRLQARDYNADAGTLTIRESKSGKPRHIVLTDEGKEFFAGAVAGNEGDALLFRRATGGMWKASQQHRPLKAACNAAKIVPVISFHVLRHTYGSMLAMRGVPLAVIAEQLGHADTRITQRHYAHLSPSYVAETIRTKMPTLGIVERDNVVALTSKQHSQ
jgi:integrase